MALFLFSSKAGYYCPNSTSVPIKCEYPYYCPVGSSSLQLCPLGYKALTNAGNRTSTNDSCSICPDGFYGNHPLRLNCSICLAGYFCPAGTPDPYKYPCPVGYYCPGQSAAAVSLIDLFGIQISRFSRQCQKLLPFGGPLCIVLHKLRT